MSDLNKSLVSGGRLAHNVVLNFLGQMIPLLIGVFTIPFFIKRLGTEHFGLLSLAWVILNYFIVFDSGLGRTTTKYWILWTKIPYLRD